MALARFAYEEIKRRHREGATLEWLAAEYEVTVSSIRNIVNGRTGGRTPEESRSRRVGVRTVTAPRGARYTTRRARGVEFVAQPLKNVTEDPGTIFSNVLCGHFRKV